MKLFKYEGYEVKVAPEALALKQFKKLWTRDKSKTKEKAMTEFAFIYFYCDIRSDYQYIIDDEDRMKAVKEGIGLPKEWVPDAVISEAVKVYKTFESPSAVLLKAALEGVDKIQKRLRSLNLDATDDKGKPVVSLRDYMAVLKMVPEVATMLKDAEKAISEEEEYGEAKGAVEKALFEDGLDEVADWIDGQHKNS